MHLGDFAVGATVYLKFSTAGAGGPITLAGSPVIRCYKNGTLAECTTAPVLTVDFDSVTGLHLVTVDTTLDAVFYAAGGDFQLMTTGGTVDGISFMQVLGGFSIQNRYVASGAPTAAEVAAAVWAYATRTLSSFGTLASDIAAAVAASLSGATVTVVSPVIDADTIELVKGDAYDVDHGRQLDIALAGAPTLVGATVKLVIGGVLEKTAISVATAGSATQTPRFELMAADTVLLTRLGTAAYHWQIQASWSADTPAQPAVLARGDIDMVARYSAT